LKIILFFLLISFLPVYTQNIWETNYEASGNVIDIDCPDSVNCFAASTGGTPFYLFASNNQGKTWELRYTNNSSTIYDMSCPDSLHIFLSFRKGLIMKSSDGGKSFEDINLDTKDIYEVHNINMRNKLIGCVSYTNILITHDGWKSYEKFKIDTNHTYIYSNPVFINDSILTTTITENKILPSINLLELNLNTFNYKISSIDLNYCNIADLCVVNENLLFACGKSNTLNGGSGHDAIYKSADGGKNWRRVLDMYYYNKLDTNSRNPFGLQQIAFKDSLAGIAVGQFGKIVYTYDGGESWIYESEIPESIDGTATMLVRYAGTQPIIGTFSGNFYRLLEDNIAPKPEDTLSISGRVWEGDKGQSGILIALGYRVMMTDSEGYYRFTRLKKGSYTVKVLSKHHDNPLSNDYYKPFDYTPLQYEIDLSKDTSGFDFNATDLRTYHTISGYVVDKDGKGLSDIDVRFAHSVITYDGLGLADTIAKTDISGKFEFHNIESYKTWDITAYDEKITFSPLKHTVRLYTNDTTDLKFVGSHVTSVEDNVIPKRIIVSPNPASDYIEISISALNPTVNRRVEGVVDKIQIFNTLGIEVSSAGGGRSEVDGGGYQIDVSKLPTGVYFVRIGDKVEKFVKM